IEGMVDSHDGKNVVIHEFAHLLDHETGSSNGAPYLNRNQSYEVWSQVLSAAYERLQHKLQNRQGSFINYYGASSPAEFFAVISEIFFEQPELLKKHEPALYLQLGEYYDVDPVNWGVKRKDKH
ncbi:MAG: zinc-dependent peptidase, partial [Gammaproteobacteria bacterium]|nr:zinc-dependent peptidase [Gammaproteobacteria bacterium]